MLQKTLADKTTAKFDFKKSLKGSLPVGILNFLWCMYMFVISPIYCMAFYTSETKTFKLICIDEYVLLSYKSAILCIGVLFAFAMFNTISNKKANNFYFANGLTRNTYYFNRVKAAITVMLISTLIPVVIDVALNIRDFGHPGYILQYGLLIYLEYISIILIGFAVASVCSVVSYTKGTAIITTGAVIAAPTVFTGVVVQGMVAFLRGFSINYDLTTVVNRYTGCFSYGNIGASERWGYSPQFRTDIFSFVSDMSVTEDIGVVSYTNTPVELILPIFYWLAVGIIALYIGKCFINKRKLENVGDRSKNVLPANFIAITGLSVVLIMVFSLIDTTVTTHGPLWSVATIAYLILIVFVSYYILLMILTGKIKQRLKVFITPAVASGVLTIIIVVFMTGCFGYTSYVPDLDKVEFAVIEVSDCYNVLNENPYKWDEGYCNAPFYSGFYKRRFEVADKDDLKIVSELAKEVAEVTEDMEYDPVTIVYYLSDGKCVIREYQTVRRDYPVLETKIEETNIYKANTEYTLIGNEEDPYENRYIKELYEVNSNYSKKYGDTIHSIFYDLITYQMNYADYKTYIVCEDGISAFKTENTIELRKSLLKDYLESSVKERFTSQDKIIGAVVFNPNKSGESEMNDYYSGNTYTYNDRYTLYIRESMKNTVNYLKSTGEYGKLFTGSNKDLVAVSVIPVGKHISVIEEYAGVDKIFYGQNYTNKNIENGFIEADNGNGIIYSSINIKDAKEPLNEMFGSAQKYTEPEKMQAIYEKVRVMGAGNSDDFLVLLEYSNGTNALRLLREEDVEKVLE